MKHIDIINELIDLMLHDLGELMAERFPENPDYVLGVKTAYVLCLEVIQKRDKNNEFGLDFNIEARYPISGKPDNRRTK